MLLKASGYIFLVFFQVSSITILIANISKNNNDKKISFNKNVPTSSNKEKQYTKNRNEGAQCMLINFLFAT